MGRRGQRGRALVSGASVAGPAAAYWLERIGYDVTVVERAPELRTGGQNVDVRATGRVVLQRMGLEDRVREHGTGEVGTRFVDDEGRTVAEYPAQQGEGHDGPTAELEILRGDLAQILVDACADEVTWRFGDSIEAIDQAASADGGPARVRFASGEEAEFDLVVVAEGVGSATRDLVLGEPDLHRLGMYVVYATIERTPDDDAWWRWLSTAGARQVQLRPDQHGTTRTMLCFRSDPSGLEQASREELLRDLRERFADVGWEAPRVLDALGRSDDVYVEDLRQVRAPVWSRGRVVLLGDAGWCVTPIGGGGTALAVVGAYVLAAYLSQHEPGGGTGDGTGQGVDRALADYEAWMRPLVAKAQDLPPGVPAVATPRSALGVALFRLGTKVGASVPVQRLATRLSSGPKASEELPELHAR